MPRTKKIETIKKTTKAPKQSGLAVDVYDVKGKVKGKITLPKEIFGSKINKQLIAQAVRVYLANQRRGSASTKTRGEVQGSTRKIYRQKGTGRARHGSLRAPIFVHGGIAFGPKPRDFSLKMAKKMKKKALFSALSAVYKDGGIKVIAGLDKITPKTKTMVQVLIALDFPVRSKILLVMPEQIETVKRAARNIEGITIMNAKQLNTYEILKNQTMLFMEQSIKTLEDHFMKETN